ncbi:MAG: AmmeMemoRadiSam system protein B [Candidatus Bathyarchaeota archaeon]|nr:MAG: AmmeMemoRadiSam system protein B [Candidatus Bathyarchaeota archaeon]
MGVRRPVVAGAFYPADRGRLIRTIEDCFTHRLGPGRLPEEGENDRRIVSVVCPHAGYMYSGPPAAHAYLHLASEAAPDVVIILGPNHTGLGGPISMGGEGAWQTPLGRVEIDEDLAKTIFRESDIIDVDDTAHMREHSIEVQLPFLQYIYEDFKFVPICMSFQDLETSRHVGRAIVNALEGRNALIVASTDMSHYESRESAAPKDRGVIDRVLQLDEAALQTWVREQRVTMCGYGPVSVAIHASKQLGATEAELLAYSTSGDFTGDHSSVVGYSSIKITKQV